FTVDEYHRLIEEGFFAADERFELLEGWIIPKMPRNPVHDAAISIITKLFDSIVPAGWHVRPQCALTLPPDGEPEPDVAVVRGEPNDYAKRHPLPPDVALVIEVANTSLDEDRELKAPNYALAEVGNYWLVNLIERCLEVYAEPSGRSPTPGFRRCH